jgi:hypothetical protein
MPEPMPMPASMREILRATLWSSDASNFCRFLLLPNMVFSSSFFCMGCCLHASRGSGGSNSRRCLLSATRWHLWCNRSVWGAIEILYPIALIFRSFRKSPSGRGCLETRTAAENRLSHPEQSDLNRQLSQSRSSMPHPSCVAAELLSDRKLWSSCRLAGLN